MASGNTLDQLFPQMRCGPSANAAQFDWIPGTSSPAEEVPVLAFDTSTVEYADFYRMMPNNYSGGGLTARIVSSAGATSGTVQWAIALRRVQDDAEDLDTTAQTYDYNTVNIGTPPSAIGEVTYDNITFTDGADMDNVAAGEYYILRIRRDTGSDTLATDAYLHSIEIRET